MLEADHTSEGFERMSCESVVHVNNSGLMQQLLMEKKMRLFLCCAAVRVYSNMG